MARLQRIADSLEAAATVLVAAALAVMTAVVIVEVIARYALNAPLIWSNEVATYLFIYSVFLGGSVALKRKELMDVQFIRDRCPPALQWLMAQLGYAIIVGFTLVGALYAVELILTSLRTGTISPALEIPMLYVYLPIPAGFGLMGFFSFVHLVRGFRRTGGPGQTPRPGGAGVC
jgi:TRAP-type C4-dicarboxylate transport system permease small subunit